MIEIEVMTLYRESDKSKIRIIQTCKNNYRIVVSIYGKHQHAENLKNIDINDIKRRLIDWIINEYTIKSNILIPDLYNELDDYMKQVIGEEEYILLNNKKNKMIEEFKNEEFDLNKIKFTNEAKCLTGDLEENRKEILVSDIYEELFNKDNAELKVNQYSQKRIDDLLNIV